MVVGAVGADGSPRIRAVGGGPGVCRSDGDRTLLLGSAAVAGSLDVADLVDGAPVGALSLVPGYGETLRVNGVLRLAPTPRIEVREVFLHCAKAVIRSRLWDDPEPGAVPSADGGTIVADGLWDPALRVRVGELPRGSRIWTDHVRLNEDPGEEAELVRQLIQEEPLAEGLAQDYAENLY